MKRYLRLCLIFLISLALPLNGMASLAAVTEPCPMQAAGMQMMGDMNPDCCEEMGSPSEHGKPCKSGQECKTASMLQVSTVKSSVTRSNPIVVAFSSDFLPTQTPSGVWRPPRF